MMVTQSKSILFRSVWYYLKCYIGNLFHIHTFGWTQSAQCAVLIVPTSVTSLITEWKQAPQYSFYKSD